MHEIPALNLIVAMDRARLIGRDGTLPWHLPNDLKRFRALTLGKPVIMGRHTHRSIGRPLPERRNLVLSRDPAFTAAGCEVVDSLDAALARVAGAAEVFVIGGAAVYAAALPQAARLYLTEVDAELEGDVRFPALDPDAWREVAREPCARDARHAHDYCFRVLERIIRAPAAGSNSR